MSQKNYQLFCSTVELLARIYTFEKFQHFKDNFQVSTLHLCCISLDRYFAIVKPFDYHYYMNTRYLPCQVKTMVITDNHDHDHVHDHNHDHHDHHDHGQVCIGDDLCGLDVPNLDLFCADPPWLVSFAFNVWKTFGI